VCLRSAPSCAPLSGGDVPAGESEPTELESARQSVPAVYFKSLSAAAALGRPHPL
jgi:hypothetical protein